MAALEYSVPVVQAAGTKPQTATTKFCVRQTVEAKSNVRLIAEKAVKDGERPVASAH